MSVFSLLPPEINSGLMYAGAGSGSLTAAAQAYNGWAEDLTTTASSISNVVSGLGSSYQGPSAAAMVSAVNPFAAWLHATAGQLSALGAQAAAQAGLYETTHAAVINPALIAANRAQLLVLIATNFFGQNAAAIAANEAQYGAYWATDAAAMDSYSTATQANAAAAQQPTAPPLAATTQSAPTLATGDPNSLSWLINLVNHLMPSGSQIPAGASLSDIGTDVMGLFNGASTATGAASNLSWIQYLSYGAMPIRYLTMLTSLGRMGSMGSMGATSLAGAAAGGSGPTALMTQIGEFVDGKLKGAVGTLVGHFNTATSSISAKLGQAASMGSMKVPQGWAAAADGMVRAAPVLPNTTVTAPVQTMSATSGMPGGPFGNALMGALAGRGVGSVAAKAPKVIPRSPSAG